MFEQYAEKWRDLHPQWGYMLHRACPPFFKVAPLVERAEEYVPAANVGQFKSDLMRYEILRHLGGVYVDMDFEPQKPLDKLLEDVDCFAAWEKQGTWIGNAILGSVPEHCFIREVLHQLPESIEKNKGKRPNISTGPQFLTRMHRASPLLTVFDQMLFYPYSFSEPQRANDSFPEAVAIHRWSNKTGLGRPSGRST